MTAHAHRFSLDRIGSGLVVADARDDLIEAIGGGEAITAPPGTGKTTWQVRRR
ncbi:hypothetical protein [Microbacterium suaedae]|uniref:hypothetical protein n=1 Tax=Microbacterium suaedae TaxID=2067813 RepID=UPI0013A618AA|nr:hypothetical protein [Microbacterium suaedae]